MNKRKLLLLKYLLQRCESGYKIVETPKVIAYLKKHKATYDILVEDINFLQTYKYIDLKYIDESNICYTVLDNTRILQENLKLEKSAHKGYLSVLIINIFVSGLMAFIGAFLAVLVLR